MTAITNTDMRRWQWAAVNVLTDLINDAGGITPLIWKVHVTAELQGSAPSGTTTERRAWLRQWAEHLGVELTVRQGPDGMTTYRAQTERTAKNGKTVRITLYDRIQTEA